MTYSEYSSTIVQLYNCTPLFILVGDEDMPHQVIDRSWSMHFYADYSVQFIRDAQVRINSSHNMRNSRIHMKDLKLAKDDKSIRMKHRRDILVIATSG